MTTSTYVTNRGLALIANGGVDLDTSDLRAAWIKNEVTQATGRDHNTLDTALTAGTEADCTGYSRKTLASATVTEDDTNDRADADYADISWGTLGGASNCQLSQVIIYKEAASDSLREVVAYIGASTLPITTNGSSVTSAIAVLFRLTSTAT